MKAFYSNSFREHYPVGTGVVVVAENADEAAKLLQAELKKCELKQKITEAHVIEITLDKPQVVILTDGNY